MWKIKKEEVKVLTNEDLDIEEARIREELRKLEERKVLPEVKPVQVKEVKNEPDISKDEIFDMIQGNFNRGLYLLDVYRRM